MVQVVDANGDPQSTQSFGVQQVTDAATHSPGSYEVRDRPGGPTHNVELASGTPVYTVLHDLARIGADVSYVEVRNPRSSHTVVLDATRGELAQPGSPGYPFTGSDSPDFFGNPAEGVGFIRPLRANDPDDVNAQDHFQSGSTSSMTMLVHTSGRPPLYPQVTADHSSVKYGRPVGFAITYADGRRPGEPATYAWSFGDGNVAETCPAASTDAAPRHTYRPKDPSKPSSYQVHVTVCGANGTQGLSPDVTVVVGKKKKPTEPGRPGGPGGGPTTGPTTGTGGGTGHHSRGAPSGRDGAGSAGRDGVSDGDAAGAGKQQAGRAGRPGEAGLGDRRVSGVLLDASSAVAVTVPAAPSAPTAAAAPRAARKIPADRRWLVVLLPIALLLGGAARQTPWLARRLPELPWRSV